MRVHARAGAFAKRDLSILISGADGGENSGDSLFPNNPPPLFHVPLTFIPPFKSACTLPVQPDPSLSRKKKKNCH